MNQTLINFSKALLFLFVAACVPSSDLQVEIWETNIDESALFEKQIKEMTVSEEVNSLPTIEINPNQRFQTMDGFGYSLTGGSAMVLHKMTPDTRASLLNELFSTGGNNIGISYLRISIGASDLDEHVFSYSDLSEGETDVQLLNFSIDEDKKYLIPVLREILEIAPDIKIMGSPWSAPKWMKTNNDTRGGSLKGAYFETYANYFVKYIQAMKKEGIVLDAITVQNEPLHPGNNPSMYMEAKDQADFIKNHLGPAFKKEGIQTKIVIYDHNLDRIDYPISILEDPEAAQYIDGSAFHLYGGTIGEMSKVHEAFPNKNLYFTEQWVSARDGENTLEHNLGWHMTNLIIGASRNWSKIVLEWNLAADENQDPHTDRGGCSLCLGAITVQGDEFSRNPAYYIIAHASKFVRPGSVRIASSEIDGLPNVAFRTPDNETVLIVYNTKENDVDFSILINGSKFMNTIRKGSAITYVW